MTKKIHIYLLLPAPLPRATLCAVSNTDDDSYKTSVAHMYPLARNCAEIRQRAILRNALHNGLRNALRNTMPSVNPA